MYSKEEFDNAKTKVVKYIMYKKRTQQEIKNKFNKTIDENMLEDIIEYLKNINYINDEEYIQRLTNDLMNLNNLSIKELTYKLYAKGLNKNLIEEYTYKIKEELEEYEIQSAQKLSTKKSNTMTPEEIKQYLMKKGYKSETLKLI